MIIFLYGEDDFRSKEELQKEVNSFVSRNANTMVRTIDAEEQDFSILNNESSSFSLFKEKTVFVIKNIFLNKEFQEKFIERKEKFSKSEDLFLIHSGEKTPKNNILFKFFQKEADCRESLPLQGKTLQTFVAKKFREKGFEVDNAFISKFLLHNGNDLWRIDNEIQKICSFRLGEEIEEEDIEFLGEKHFEKDIFKTIDAIAEDNKKKALSLIREHLKDGEDPIYLLSMIVYQFRNILVARDLIERGEGLTEMQNDFKVHPFVARKSFQLSKKFSLDKLKKIYSKIFRVDFNVKTGRIDPTSALDLLVVEI